MSKKAINLIITGVSVAVVIIIGVVVYHFYQESQKSGVERAVDSTADATKKAAKWTEKKADQAADKTKQLFK